MNSEGQQQSIDTVQYSVVNLSEESLYVLCNGGYLDYLGCATAAESRTTTRRPIDGDCDSAHLACRLAV